MTLKKRNKIMPSTQYQNKQFLDLISHFHEVYKSKLADMILEGSFPKERLPLLAVQFYLLEKWPSHIAHVYLGLDEQALADRDIVNYIITIIKAENLGVGSKGVPHSMLARRFAIFTGLSDEDLDIAHPTTQNRTLMDWCDMSALERPWIEALAVHIACESQVKSMAKIANGLKFHYGTSKENVQFWSIHGGSIEKKHSQHGLALLAKHTSKAEEENVLYSYKMSCRLLCEFNDSILEKQI